MASLNIGLPVRQDEDQQQARGKKAQRLFGKTIWYAILVIGAIISLFPYYLAFLTSVKPANQIFAGAPWSLPTTLTLDNYVSIMTQYNFPGYIVQTLIFAVVSTLGQLFFSTFAAYAFARMRFPGRDILFWLYLATMMVPNIVTIVPLFILMSTLNWVNTYAGLIVPFTFSANSANADPTVKARTASSTLIFCSGIQPSGCFPSSVCRVTAALMPSSGLNGATGQSDPNAITAPVFSNVRKA